MKWIMLILVLTNLFAHPLKDAKEISRHYMIILDMLKNPDTQPIGHYYSNDDGYSYVLNGVEYKTQIFRVISESNDCRGTVFLDQRQDGHRIVQSFPYDLRHQSFLLNGDMITLIPSDSNATITVHTDRDKEATKEEMLPYVQFGWKAYSHYDILLKKSLRKYTQLCKEGVQSDE